MPHPPIFLIISIISPPFNVILKSTVSVSFFVRLTETHDNKIEITGNNTK